MTHNAWAETITGRPVAHLSELTGAEAKAVHAAAEREQQKVA
jgi:hypothetical protein